MLVSRSLGALGTAVLAGVILPVALPKQTGLLWRIADSRPPHRPLWTSNRCLVQNAGKPGYYTIASGDTLIRVGLEHGQS